MFEAAEVGHHVGKAAFERAAGPLRERLLQLQARAQALPLPVLVIIAGVEMAGKSEVVNRLNEWLDARGVRTLAFWEESDEERERPAHWRYWRELPPAGEIGILMGSWYTPPIVDRATRESGRQAFEAQLARIVELERTLTDGGTLIVKLWFHVSRREQAKRLAAVRRDQKRKLTPYEKSFSKRYVHFEKASEAAIRHTDLGHAPWFVIDAHDRRYRDLAAGRTLAEALERRLRSPRRQRRNLRPPVPPPEDRRTVLDTVDLGARLSERRYDAELDELQTRLNLLSWRARNARRSTVALFEGWDAAGKGGAIRRVVRALDARLVRVIPVAAPTDEEKAHHYLWRFWRHLPRAGYFTLYDRSWYGRVLVERVEGFAQPEEWARAYGEINAFEEQLTEHGICLLKFWLHLSPQEQLRRFRARQKVAYKRYKLGREDWRNRQKWKDYTLAVDEMVARTSTAYAPWTLVAAEDKRVARVTVLRTMCEALELALKS